MPQESQLTLITAENLSTIPWLLHAFSTRTAGSSRVYGGNSLNLGFTQHDTRIAVERNRVAFLKKLGALHSKKPWPLVTLSQVHS
ncbi:MAG TPA: laccase domain-containing protein, partial [Terriglobales bacterium]